jgi:hypothetical protein
MPGSAVHKAAAAGDYGTVIRLCRRERGLTLDELGEACGYSHSALSRLEQRGRWGVYNVATLHRIAEVLDIAPDLLGLAGRPKTPDARPPGPMESPSDAFPVGHVFSTSLPTATPMGHGRRLEGRIVLDLTNAVDTAAPRGILIAEVDDTTVAIEARRTCRCLSRAAPHAPLIVPTAYVLDDLTIGIAWTVANLDEPLLGDDARLHAVEGRLFRQASAHRSPPTADATEDLHPGSKMWLGSSFCARHILSNIRHLAEPPSFWTQERRGEEASGWLLFAHKFDYLRSTTAKYPGAGMARAFCVPADAVATSAAPERVLLLLAAALIESFGIKVVLCTEPGYTAVEGCVLDSDRQAIVASWVGVEALWHVGVTQACPAVREFSDAINRTSTSRSASKNTAPRRTPATCSAQQSSSSPSSS